MVTLSITRPITDENVDDIMDTSGYGIGYWATEATQEERDAAPENALWVIKEQESDDVFYLTRDDVRKAVQTALDDETFRGGYVWKYIFDSVMDGSDDEGLDTGHIDADAADAIVQYATLGEVVYG